MKRRTAGKERRRQPRFRLSGSVLALAGPRGGQRGKVAEISRGGLSFLYQENGGGRFRAQRIDLLWSDFVAAHHLEKLPVRTVSDTPVQIRGQHGLRRTGVAFTRLSPAQESRLDRLICSYGIGVG